MTDNPAGSSRAEKKKEQIRAAARQLFLQNGFLGTSTDAIMAAARIASKETLYRYYPGKEELFLDVLRSLTVERPHFQQLIEHHSSPSNLQELEALLKTVIREVLATMFQPEYMAVIKLIADDQEEPLPLDWSIIVEEWDHTYWIVWIFLLWMLWIRDGRSFKKEHDKESGWVMSLWVKLYDVLVQYSIFDTGSYADNCIDCLTANALVIL